MIPTPHIEVDKKGIIAETVIMPGDPLRAKFIAENFLENPVLFNTVRNMFGFTGTYKGKKISVMGSGMGMPSIGIYSYELFKFYDVQNIIRVGSCGAYSEEIDLYDVILVEDSYSESTYAKVMAGIEDNILKPSSELNKRLEEAAKSLNIPIHKGRIHSSDVFYRQNFDDYKKIRDNYGCIAVEMESFALFANAQVTGKNAACLLTVSDSLVTMKATTSEERMKSFTNMMKIALEMA
ncbi:purine-nucleoside phosphorylase [Marinitoga sp. 38H-ov]|uniref:purine-nucleoside phosphorylase n=1 Tax=Marinitoga sp. 38H-ov TaxID=1755814 RepID=UPI0013EA5735|nr:purine-nucleoside phosphorylase [Marinitoga sp. 38H-ov]KAF2956211.1 purine nucleoside phosphorylase DeoD-type [Marinitoga sp. 38H-ov]